MPYLEKRAQKEDLVFQEPDLSKYKRSGKAFYRYPEAKVEDVFIQGEIARWLYASLKENPGFTPEDDTALLLDKSNPVVATPDGSNPTVRNGCRTISMNNSRPAPMP